MKINTYASPTSRLRCSDGADHQIRVRRGARNPRSPFHIFFCLIGRSVRGVVGNKLALFCNYRHQDGIIALYKERLQGATPDQARAKIESLEAQVLSLKAREWPPLTL